MPDEFDFIIADAVAVDLTDSSQAGLEEMFIVMPSFIDFRPGVWNLLP